MRRMLYFFGFNHTQRRTMKKYKEGDKSRAICHDCGLVNTTFYHRDVTVEKISVYILAGVCEKCNQVVSIPSQATPAIKKALAAGSSPSITTPT